MEGIARGWWISARDLEGWRQEILEEQSNTQTEVTQALWIKVGWQSKLHRNS
jgi:hypothetical protein